MDHFPEKIVPVRSYFMVEIFALTTFAVKISLFLFLLQCGVS
jgi:hypothetical protein